MTWFDARNHSEAVLQADRTAVWKALTDTDLLPRLTPFLSAIDVDGDHWVWHLTSVPILSTSLAPSFTERMAFEEQSRIEFRHDPPDDGPRERAAVEGWYALADHDEGTHVEIDLTVKVDVPVGRLAGGAVRPALKTVIGGMGRKFGDNLVRHLDG